MLDQAAHDLENLTAVVRFTESCRKGFDLSAVDRSQIGKEERRLLECLGEGIRPAFLVGFSSLSVKLIGLASAPSSTASTRRLIWRSTHSKELRMPALAADTAERCFINFRREFPRKLRK